MKSFIVVLAKALTPNYLEIARQKQSIQMVTICFSHYCELAMWALEKGNKPVIEHDYVPGQHVFPAMRVRICNDNGKKNFSNTSRLIGVREQEVIEKAGGVDKLSEEERKKFRKRDASARATAVPVAVLPDGNVLLDSWSIAEYSGLQPVPEDMKNLFDNELGPQARQAAYSIILKKSNISYFHKLCTLNRSWFIRLLWSLFLGNYILKLMIKMFSPYDQKTVLKCKDSLKTTFDKLDRIVTERKGQFLLGDKLSLADIALASLAAPILLPPLYCGGKYNIAFQGIYDSDSEGKSEVDRFRSTVAGQYVMNLYANHR